MSIAIIITLFIFTVHTRYTGLAAFRSGSRSHFNVSERLEPLDWTLLRPRLCHAMS